VKSLQDELNFMTEGHNAEHVAANFEGNDQIVIPKSYWEWTRQRINVQAFVDGIPGVNLHAIDAAGIDRKRIAQTGASAVLKMIMMDGLFHADPHPGKFFILPGERIAFIDFGMIGRVSEIRRQQIMKLLQALLQNDADGLCAILLEWSDREGDDPGELSGAVEEFLGQYAGKSMALMDLSAMIWDLLRLVRDNRLTMPSDQAMLLKVFVSLDGAFKKLDPGFPPTADTRRDPLIGGREPYTASKRIREASPPNPGVRMSLSSCELRARRHQRANLSRSRAILPGHTSSCTKSALQEGRGARQPSADPVLCPRLLRERREGCV
jgi:ubiquinone biosynthesis protein